MQVLHLLPDGYQLDRHPDFVGYGERDAPLRRPVEFGQYDPGQPGNFLEHLSLPEPVLPRGRIDGHEHLVRRTGKLTLHDPLHLVQLGHEVHLGVQPARRVDEQHVRALTPCGVYRLVGDGGSVSATLARYDWRARPFSPFLQLLDGRRPEGVAGGEYRRPWQETRELADGGCFAGPVYADHEDHGRRVRDVQFDRAFQHARGVVDHELAQLGAAGDVILKRLLLQLGDELG